MIIYSVGLVFVSWTHDRRLDCGKISVERLPFLLINMVAVTFFDSNLLLGPWICYKKVFPLKVILKTLGCERKQLAFFTKYCLSH